MSTIKKQVKKYRADYYDENGDPCTLIAEVRHDDCCNNGHNSFAITGDLYEKHPHRGEPTIKHAKTSQTLWLGSGGCLHDEIAKRIPELAPFIKWHLCSTDGPMHYIANTTYHARDCDHEGKRPGDPVRFDTRLQFAGFPFTFKEPEKGFFDYLDSVGDFQNIEVEPVPYDGKDSYKFGPKYSLTGFIKENQSGKWYKAPFDELHEAQEFLTALRTLRYVLVKIPTKWAEAVTPNLEYARSSAIWPDATLEQLRDKEALAARLPAILAEFKRDVESLGLVF